MAAGFLGKKRKKKKTGSVNSKKYFIDGHEFASGLEKNCYLMLKSEKLNIPYEPETFTILDGFKYPGVDMKNTPSKTDLYEGRTKNNLPITYTPDFVSHELKVIIETKGYVPSNHSFTLRWKLFKLYLCENNMGDYSLYRPRNLKQIRQMIDHIKQNLNR